MQFSKRLAFALLLTTVSAQLNTGLIFSELPACSVSCSEQALPAAGCHLEDIQNCLCRNTSLQSQLSVCIQMTCNYTEQFFSASVFQNVICDGVPQPSRSGDIVRAVIILSVIAFPVIVFRFMSRHLLAEIWWDDWVILAAGALMIPASFIGIYNTTRGFGKHIWDVPPGDIETLEELYYVSQILYVGIKNLSKASVLLLFLRVFPDQRFRILTKIFLVWIACNAFAFSIAITLQCIPVKAVWDISVNGKCVNSRALVFSGAGISMFEDIVIILLPVPELKSLALSLRKRLAVMFLFALGSFACVTSMVRLKYIVAFQIRSLDATWDSTDILIWSFVEDYTAVICVSLITIRPLLTKYIPTVFRRMLNSQNDDTYFASHPNVGSSISAGALRGSSPGSAMELKLVRSWESVHNEGQWLKSCAPKIAQLVQAHHASDGSAVNSMDVV